MAEKLPQTWLVALYAVTDVNTSPRQAATHGTWPGLALTGPAASPFRLASALIATVFALWVVFGSVVMPYWDQGTTTAACHSSVAFWYATVLRMEW